MRICSDSLNGIRLLDLGSHRVLAGWSSIGRFSRIGPKGLELRPGFNLLFFCKGSDSFDSIKEGCRLFFSHHWASEVCLSEKKVSGMKQVSEKKVPAMSLQTVSETAGMQLSLA